MKYSNNIKWKVKVCHVGKKCWCRAIVTVDGNEVIDGARIDTAFAKYIVKLHNVDVVRLGVREMSLIGVFLLYVKS